MILAMASSFDEKMIIGAMPPLSFSKFLSAPIVSHGRIMALRQPHKASIPLGAPGITQAS